MPIHFSEMYVHCGWLIDSENSEVTVWSGCLKGCEETAVWGFDCLLPWCQDKHAPGSIDGWFN
jgi:hypothetical protein